MEGGGGLRGLLSTLIFFECILHEISQKAVQLLEKPEENMFFTVVICNDDSIAVLSLY